jgi:hypothetical protein
LVHFFKLNSVLNNQIILFVSPRQPEVLTKTSVSNTTISSGNVELAETRASFCVPPQICLAYPPDFGPATLQW